MARAPFFLSRHAENVIWMAWAPPAAHGRREQIVPLQHLLGCGALEFSQCRSVQHERTESCINIQLTFVVDEAVTIPGFRGVCAMQQEIAFLHLQQTRAAASCNATGFQSGCELIDVYRVEQVLKDKARWREDFCPNEFCVSEKQPWH